MAFPLKPLVPCLCTTLLLLLNTSFSHAKTEPCKCPDSDQDRRSYQITIDEANAGSKFYLIDKESGIVRTVGLNFLYNLSGSEQENTQVFSTVNEGIPLWQVRPGGLAVDEASFSVTIVYQPLPNQMPSGIAFLIIPIGDQVYPQAYWANNTFPIQDDDGSLYLQGTPTSSRNANVSGSSVSVAIGALNSKISGRGIDYLGMAIDINIDAAAAFTYAVWIDYDRLERRLSAYVDVEGKPKPASPIAEAPFNMSSSRSNLFDVPLFDFGLLSTVAQLNVSRWNATVENLLPPYFGESFGPPPGFAILISVLGSVAMTAMMATALAYYFKSRYRRWHRDLEQLARSMERLPGVPIKVEFADIKKATGNFHETMKLGGGGFGTVYRCTLPAKASKTKLPMDVAVKRFTRDVQNRRYDDFLAEVSIINRLRHKNIVPLVGWSYNKGEPLLVFEFMPNGSLDQHLFPKGGNGTGNQGEPGPALRCHGPGARQKNGALYTNQL